MQTINLHIYEKKTLQPILRAKQGDVGRKFKVIITDGTDGYAIPADVNFSVWYSGASGVGNYTHIGEKSAFAISGNSVVVELIAQMLNNAGCGELCLIMSNATGDQIGTWNVPYMAEKVPGMGSKPAQQHLNALADAQKKAENSAIDASVYVQDASMYRDEAREWAEAAEGAANSVLYANLSTAITDINNGVTDNAVSALEQGKVKVKVFTADNGKQTVMLLDDVAESTQIDVNKDICLVLAGHTLSFTGSSASLVFGANTDCVIDGTVAGSTIYKNAAGTGTIILMQSDGKKLVIKGGEYTLTGPTSAALLFKMNAAEFEMYDAEVNCSTPASATHTRAIQSAGNAILKNCTITAVGAEQPTGLYVSRGQNVTIADCAFEATSTENSNAHAYGIRVNGGNLTIVVERSKITAVSGKFAHGIYNPTGDFYISNSTVFADTPGGHANSSNAIGIHVGTTMFCKDTNVTGTHSAISNYGALYVSGGTFMGSTHGGFYLAHGADGIAYIRDATIRCGLYTGQFTDFWTSGENTLLGALYVGGGTGANNSNVTAYLDGCVINDNEEGAIHCLVLRGSDGETGHCVNISNSQCTGKIRIDNDTMLLNVGVGTNITTGTFAGSAAEYAAFTDKLYRKHHERETLNGKDFATLLAYAQ